MGDTQVVAAAEVSHRLVLSESCTELVESPVEF